MKTRNGFVSNSSSSSFIVLGFQASDSDLEIVEDPNDPYQLKEEYRQKGWNTLYVDGKGMLFGIVIDDVSYALSDQIFTLDELKEREKELQEAFPDKEIFLYTGTRAT